MNPNLNESSLVTTATSATVQNTTPYTLPPTTNPPNSAPTASTRARTTHPASIRHSQSFEPQQTSAWSRSEGGLATKRSSASLNLLSSSSPQGSLEQDPRSSILPIRSSGFSNPFKKLQNTFGNSKKSLEFGNNSSNNNNINNGNYVVNGNRSSNNSSSSNNNYNNITNVSGKVVSSSSSANSLTSSWRSKGAEMLSKANWRSRKNSEVNNQEQAAPIFGALLEDAVKLSHIPGTPLVPAVLHRCAEFLEAKGVQEVGLYRVPGSHANVQRLKRMFDTGQDYDLLSMDAIDPNDIATLLKLYLRDLPNPLLPPTLLEQFQSLLTTDRHICHTLRGILIRLPRSNYVVLSYLCHHLSKIAAHSDTTKMTVSNLGVVFAPTINIGSVLFKALLGGFYDGVDTPENREKGLKIVWGGLLQDLEFGIPDYDDEEGQEEGCIDTNATSTPHKPIQKEEYYDETDSISHEISAPPNLAQGENGVPSPDPEIPGTPTSDYTPGQDTHPLRSESPKEDEDRLMSAMMLQEEKAVKGEPADYPSSSVTPTSASYSTISSSSPPSHSTSAANMPLFLTTTTASSVATATSSFDASRPRDHAYFQDQVTSSTSHQELRISIGAGSSTSGSLDSYQSPTKSQETPRSASGAPQLPPLEGLSIAM